MKAVIVGIGAALALQGCVTGKKPGYDTAARPVAGNCIEAISDKNEVSGSGCPDSALLTLAKPGALTQPTLAFFEFQDGGAAYDPALVAGTLSQLQALNKSDKRLLQVLFVHGWNHNALQSDPNVQSFKKFLVELQEQEDESEVGQRRQVVGVYLSWPGRVSTNFVAQLLSFRDRKESALQVGAQNATRDLLAELSRIRSEHAGNRFVLIGHSFGGGFVFKATEDALGKAVADGKVSTAEVFGDVVVLVNPAVEAQRFIAMHEQVKRDFGRCTAVQLASFTSTGDTALSNEFPTGMKLFYAKATSKLDGEALTQATTPYGLYEPLQQFKLDSVAPIDPNSAPGAFTPTDYSAAHTGWTSFRNNAGAFEVKGMRLQRLGPSNEAAKWTPVMNVLVNKDIIPEHSDIWRPHFSLFVRALVGMQFSKRDNC